MQEAILEMRRRTPPQKRISESKARFNVAAWGRQSGKTTFGLDKMTYRPLQGRPGGIYWYVLQTYSTAETAHRRFYDMHIGSGLLRGRPHFADLYFTLRNNSRVCMVSGKNYQDLRAETLDGAIIDEFRQQSPSLWPQVIRPMLSRRKGWCDFFSTPNGFEHFYDLFQKAKADGTGEWAAFHAPSTQSWWWTPEEIASSKATMSEAEFAQEILAEFRNIHSGKAYLSEGEWNQLEYSPFLPVKGLVAPYLPVVLGCDFNVNPMSWHLGQFKNEASYWFDEIHVANTNTHECAEVLGQKLLELKAKDLLKSSPSVIICGDATGEARNTKATESDYAIIQNVLNRLGITWTTLTPDSNPPVKERVNTMNTRLKAANGSVQLFYHPTNCPALKRDLERVSWKEGNAGLLDQTTDSSLTHASDSVGYPICVLAPIKSDGAVGTLRVVRR